MRIHQVNRISTCGLGGFLALEAKYRLMSFNYGYTFE